MKLMPWLICLILALPLYVGAQEHPHNFKDSLANILTQKTTDSIKARASFLLSDEWSYTDTAKTKQFLELGRKLSGKNKYLQALYVFYTALFLFDSDKPKAEKLFLQSDSLLSTFNTPEAYFFRSRCWRNYGALRMNAGDSKAMLGILVDKAIPFTIKSGSKQSLAKNYADVGLIFMNRWQYGKAESYYDKAIAILRETARGKSDNLDIYNNAIRNLLYMDKLVEAKRLIDHTKPMIMPGTLYEIDFLLNEGIYFVEGKQYQNALSVLGEALKAANKLTQPDLAESVRFQQYRAYTGLGNYEKAIAVLLYIVRNPSRSSSQNRLTHYYELAEIYAKQGDMKSAYKWQKEYSRLQDTINNGQLNKDLNALEIKFRNVENQKKITELNAANTKAALDAKNSRLINWLLGSVSLFLLAVAILVLFFYRSYKRSSAQKAQIEITKTMIQVQEEERSRVARDLHDGLGGMLTTVKLNLEDFALGKENSDNPGLRNIIKYLDSSVKELRRIAHNMMPEMLLNLGLEASLNDLCELLTTKNLHIDFQCLGIENTIRLEAKITIYRIIQELLTNIVKHADAKNVLLQCAQHGAIFFITIEDDGKGFDTDLLTQMSGIGLNNIKNRVAYLHGKVELLSGNQQGTSINIELNVTI